MVLVLILSFLLHLLPGILISFYSYLWFWPPGISIVHSPSPKERSLPQSQPPLEFVPPATPPSRHQWVPDGIESICMICRRERFTMVSSVCLQLYLQKKLKENSSSWDWVYNHLLSQEDIGIFRGTTECKTGICLRRDQNVFSGFWQVVDTLSSFTF